MKLSVHFLVCLFCLQLALEAVAQPLTNLIEYTVEIKNEGVSEEEWYRENIDPSARRPWLEQLLADAENGTISVYAPMDTEFETPLTTEAVKAILYKVDTIFIESQEPPYELKQEVITTELDIALIDRIKFRERWSWHKKKGLQKVVIAFAPMMASLDSSTGEVRGWMPLFWMKP